VENFLGGIRTKVLVYVTKLALKLSLVTTSSLFVENGAVTHELQPSPQNPLSFQYIFCQGLAFASDFFLLVRSPNIYTRIFSRRSQISASLENHPCELTLQFWVSCTFNGTLPSPAVVVTYFLMAYCSQPIHFLDFFFQLNFCKGFPSLELLFVPSLPPVYTYRPS